MSTMQVTQTVTQRGRGANIALWVLQVLLAAAFLMAGMSKLAGVEMMVKEFDALGLGQWFRYLTGGLEVAAALLLLIPGRGGYGGLLLVPIMLGAIVSHLFVTKDSPVAPMVLFVLAAIVAYGRLAWPRTRAV